MTDNKFLVKLRTAGCPDDLVEIMGKAEGQILRNCDEVGPASELALELTGDQVVAVVQAGTYLRDALVEAMEEIGEQLREELREDILRAAAANYHGPYEGIALLPSKGVYILPSPPEMGKLMEEVVTDVCRNRWGSLRYASTVKRMLAGFSPDTKGGHLFLTKEDVEPFVEAAVLAVESERLEVLWKWKKKEAERRLGEQPLYGDITSRPGANLVKGTLVAAAPEDQEEVASPERLESDNETLQSVGDLQSALDDIF